MTELQVLVIEVPELVPIAGADRIAVAQVGGYNVIVNKEQTKKGDKCIFVPVDAVIPKDMLAHYDLDIKNGRVRTKKLRGVYSQGVILPMTYSVFERFVEVPQVGENIAKQLGIEKYAPPINLSRISSGGLQRPWVDPRMITYDIENLQNPRNRGVFEEGEEVVMTEKIHGMHGAACWVNGKFYYTSRKRNLDVPHLDENGVMVGGNIWNEMVKKFKLEDKVYQIAQELKTDICVLRFEVYGKSCQDLDYGLTDQQIALFDIENGFNNFINQDDFSKLCHRYDLPICPELYRGPFSIAKAEEMAEKNSTISKKKDQRQEGVVIKDLYEGKTKENKLYMNARKILKQVSKRYLEKSDGDLVTDE